jgi:hypothetical protein
MWKYVLQSRSKDKELRHTDNFTIITPEGDTKEGIHSRLYKSRRVFREKNKHQAEAIPELCCFTPPIWIRTLENCRQISPNYILPYHMPPPNTYDILAKKVTKNL